MTIFRYPDNPVIGLKDVKPCSDEFEVIGVFNAGVAKFADEVILLLRVAERPISEHPDMVLAGIYDVADGRVETKEFSKDDPKNDFSDPRFVRTPGEVYLTSISNLRLARSRDGLNFEIEQTPSFLPANEYESYGLEDPRISLIEKTYYIDYIGVGPLGVTTSLASTKDFKSFKRHGIMFPPDNKDVVLFPEKINGKYYCLHRPVSKLSGRPEMWVAESSDLMCWGNHRYLMGLVPNSWQETRIGAGAPPIKTKAGWLEIYHAADQNERYCLGAVLLDINEPWKIIKKYEKPIFEPQAQYERQGFFGEVVFTCGLLAENDKLKIYYGAADTSLCYAELILSEILST